jgi:hypothetical protein
MVHDLDVFGICSRPTEADAEPIVHPKAPLTCTIALQLLEAIGRRRSQVIDAPRVINVKRDYRPDPGRPSDAGAAGRSRQKA